MHKNNSFNSKEFKLQMKKLAVDYDREIENKKARAESQAPEASNGYKPHHSFTKEEWEREWMGYCD